MVEMPAQ